MIANLQIHTRPKKLSAVLTRIGAVSYSSLSGLKRYLVNSASPFPIHFENRGGPYSQVNVINCGRFLHIGVID